MMDITVDGDKVIVNGYVLYGMITNTQCKTCGSELILHLTWDAMFCPQCNEWKEPKCKDPKCSECANRPNQPLPFCLEG
jgi:hypothetical protein